MSGTAGSVNSVSSAQLPVSQQNGPSADYPITVGEPYVVNGTEYVPLDTMNYDHVGYLTVDQGARGITGTHHTLPLPSYVEVTSLETGRTILVRLERRGPMDSNNLLGLSPAALEQLGAGSQTPVRVRRVNPPEAERFALRSGEAAPERMDTPASLLTVLQRRLPESGAASLRPDARAASPAAQVPAPVVASNDQELPAVASATSLPPIGAAPHADEGAGSGEFAAAFENDDANASEAAPAPGHVEQAAEGRFVVQAAAFSTRDRADRVANTLGGMVTQAGRFWRVRTGPFATRGEAEASLANVRRAGYSDARILTSG
ncbi:SPOR domain-containing protein [Aurantiacibacter sp. MUD61]|uniref:SPOR domain-containing protein n=1 Tax=Aurantiacibacter sp. MUD61 TaxID=3009083 RepID=UPI0022F0C6C7|nr:SPOR domain-containing protein [Aurantiacibacter sp. MUD61]